MKDKGLNSGLVQEFNTSKRGENKAFFGFRKMFRDYLTKLNVVWFDSCCPDASGTREPIGYNPDTDKIERFNKDTGDWGNAPLTVDSSGLTSGTMFAGFYPSAVQENIAAGIGGAINVVSYFTTINTDAGGDAFTLANGTVIGQKKRIRLIVDGGGDGVVTPVNLDGATTITFNDADDDVELLWNGTDWIVLANIGAIIA